MALNSSFWRGRRVFLTGHTGFKGSWLSVWLQSMGAQVTGFALPPPSGPNLFQAIAGSTGIRSVMGDITNFSLLSKELVASKAEVVIHMAAQALVRRSYEDPVGTYATNVLGTVNLLEAVRRTPSIRAVVNVTTDKCYENREWLWAYREDDTLGGHDPYSNSKACSELVTASFRDSFFNPANYSTHGVGLASARAGNVIGGGDWAVDRLVPDIIKALASDVPVAIRNPNSIRPWQHVLEPIAGYLMLAERLFQQGNVYSGGWNFGPEEKDAQTVERIVEQLSTLWGSSKGWSKDSGNHPHEARYLKLDTSKARALLDWSPRWTLPQALAQIVNWHKAYLDQNDMRAVTLEQIHQFESSTHLN